MNPVLPGNDLLRGSRHLSSGVSPTPPYRGLIESLHFGLSVQYASEARVHRLTFQGKYPKHTFVDPPKGFLSYKALKRLNS